MPKPLSDDLGRRILEAYARRKGSQAELARRFQVSFEFVRKLRKELRKTGRVERIAQARHNAPSRMALRRLREGRWALSITLHSITLRMLRSSALLEGSTSNNPGPASKTQDYNVPVSMRSGVPRILIVEDQMKDRAVAEQAARSASF